MTESVRLGQYPAGPPAPLTEKERGRVAILRQRLGELRRRKTEMLEKIRELDAEESGLAEVFQKHFPNEEFAPPPVQWEKLTHEERLTCHYIACRGGVRRVRSVVNQYVLETQDIVSGDGWAARLAGLKSKGALIRNYHGYFIAPVHAEVASRRPPELGPGTPVSQLVRKIQTIPDQVRRRPSWTSLGQGPKRRDPEPAKKLKPLLP